MEGKQTHNNCGMDKKGQGLNNMEYLIGQFIPDNRFFDRLVNKAAYEQHKHWRIT